MSAVLVASIGTTHPWNIAGVGLDARIGSEYGVRVVTAVAAVSAQDAHGMSALHAIPGTTLRAQLRALPWEHIDAIRVGALASQECVREVAAALRAVENTPAVVDPVMRASLGGTFASDDVVDEIRRSLATLPSVILTPNLIEAARLLDRTEIAREALGAAARDLRAFGTRAVLVKGGHLAGEPADALAYDHGTEIFRESRLAGDMRGSGCTLAMSLACELARGKPLVDAVAAARAFVRSKISGKREFQGLHVAY